MYEVTTARRSRAIAAMIEGFFAVMWLSWGQGSAPSWLNRPVFVASVVSLVVVVAGLVATIRTRGDGAGIPDVAMRSRYNLIVGLEVVLIAGGAAVLGATGLNRWIIVWVCAVVGIHFVPLAAVFRGLHLVPLGILVTAMAVTALIVGATTSVTPGGIAGLGAGGCLLVAGIVHLGELQQRRGVQPA